MATVFTFLKKMKNKEEIKNIQDAKSKIRRISEPIR